MSKPWKPYARHILDTIAKIRRIEARGDIVTDDILYDAALRNLQTMSEATQLLPAEKKAACPQIPWRDIIGFRNLLVHNYLCDLDPATVAAVIREHLEELEQCICAMLDADRHGDS